MTAGQDSGILVVGKAEQDSKGFPHRRELLTIPIRILIADDQPRARQSLTALLRTLPQVVEIHEAVDGQEALRCVAESRPDVVLMDVRMPEMDGLQATRLIKTRWPRVKVIVLSMYTEYIADAVGAGADAFVSKGEPPDKLLETLAAVGEDLEREA
jgi:DNA-binding NarL/FixJ family response regulator